MATLTLVEIAADSAAELPRLYLGCPLTVLSESAKRQLKSDIASAKKAIEAVTVSDRIEDERWPVSVYAPIEKTSPWETPEMTSSEVYRTNLLEVHNSDVLIAIGEGGGSAGIGQELEWAIRFGIPALYLSPIEVSRQIEGAPGSLQTATYEEDAKTLEAVVQNFLRTWRHSIVDGPRRRSSRRLRFASTTQQLRHAWESSRRRTEVAAQVGMDFEFIDLALSDPILVSAMSAEALFTLAAELGVSMMSHDSGPAFVVSAPHLRSLMIAADKDGWSNEVIEILLIHGRASIQRGDDLKLHTLKGWRDLRRKL